MGHWYAQYALDKPVWRPKDFDGPDNGNPYAEEEWERRRYPPYFDVLKPGPLDYNNVSVDDAAPLRHSIQFRLSVIDEVRLGVLEAKREPSGPGEFDPHTQREQDRTRRLHALLGIGPRWGPALDEVLRLLAGGARMAASALTVLYWATRRTTTGLSVTGLAFLVAGEILRHVAGTWDYYHSTLRGGVFWVVIWPILFLPELLQLRLLLPYRVEREDFAGRPPAWRLARLPATARERRSARLGPDWRQVGALAGVLACAAFALLAHPVRLLPGSHDGSHAETYDALYPGSRAYNKWWAYLGYEWQHEMPLAHRLLRKIWLLPLAQSLVSAGQVAQLVMNHRARTFAGNYALACALKAVALVSLAAPFIAGSALNDGLYLSAALQAALVLAETWQAWTYPRVEQETDGEEMEM